MIRLDGDWLTSLGLGTLPGAVKNALLAQSYKTLEQRVGAQLAAQLSDEQIGEFEALIDAEDQLGAAAWLDANLPHYRDVVAATLAELEVEIRSVATDILAAEGITSAPDPSTLG